MSHFSEGQIHQFSNSAEKAGFMPKHLTKLGQSQELLEGFLSVLDGKADIVFRDGHIVEKSKEVDGYLSRLYPLEMLKVPSTDGTQTLSGSGLFPAGVFREEFLPRASRQTTASKVAVFEVIKSGTFSEIFSSLGPGRRRFTQHQVVAFVREHRRKLAVHGCTFFEMEECGMVAHVDWDNGSLWADLREFGSDFIWTLVLQHRIVVLQ